MRSHGFSLLGSGLFAIVIAMVASIAQPAHAADPKPIDVVGFVYNNTMTTPYGPAAADVVVQPSNMMSCAMPTASSFSYALCYYSGPAAPTGLSGSNNPALPCVMAEDGKSAVCECFKVTPSLAAGKPYQVDINAILNLGVYKATVAKCGQQGDGCNQSTTSTNPACKAVENATMMPSGAPVSVFSLYKVGDYSTGQKPGSTSCTAAPYAGCMTAPCLDTGKVKNGQPIVDCRCPIYNGPYQVGQDGATCDANKVANPDIAKSPDGAKYVWSASYTPPPSKAPPTKK